MSPNTFRSSTALPCLPAAVPWLFRLQAIAEDPTESSRGLSPLGWTSSKAFLCAWENLILGDPSSILSGLLIRSMKRRRGIALPNPIRVLRPASPQSLPNSTRRRRRSSSVSRVAGARACPPFAEEPPEHELALPSRRRSRKSYT